MKRGRGISMRAMLMVILFVLLLPLTLLFGIGATVQINAARQSVIRTEEASMDVMANQQEMQMKTVERQITDLVLNSAALHALAEKIDETQRYFSTYEVYLAFGSILGLGRHLTGLQFYCRNTEIFFQRDSGITYLAYDQRVRIREQVGRYFVEACAENRIDQNNWFITTVDGRAFLCRSVYFQGVDVMAYFDLQYLAEDLGKAFESEFGIFFHDGEVALTSTGLNETWIQELSGHKSQLFNQKGDRLLVVNCEVVGVWLTSVTRFDETFRYSGMLLVMPAVAILLLLAYPIILWFVRESVFQPLTELTRTMERIRHGDMTARATKLHDGHELRRVNDTFNEMLTRIELLKIETYERELEVKQVQLQYYQVQIRPHFYLNCLKNIYSLAEQHEFANIETSILYLSNYLRYTFQGNENTVSLQEELQQCDNYMKLLGVSAAFPPRLEIDVDARAMEFPVPPVSVLTFVENCLRHCMSTHETLVILVEARILATEEGDCIHVSVRDNGRGFPQEVLRQLNDQSWKLRPGHIGLKNVVQRCQLLYGERFSIAFSNEGDGGLVEMFFILPEERGEICR